MTTILTLNPNALYDQVTWPLLEVATRTLTPLTTPPYTVPTRYLGEPGPVGAAWDRVCAGFMSSGMTPRRTMAVHVSPPGVVPDTGIDLALAAAVLLDQGTGGPHPLLRVDGATYGGAAYEGGPYTGGVVVTGDIALDGYVRPVRGLLPGLLAARDTGVHLAIVPDTQMDEARLSGLTIIGVRNLLDLETVLQGGPGATPRTFTPAPPTPGLPTYVTLPAPVADALLVAAAGHHHLMITSPRDAAWWGLLGPVTASLLPPLTHDQALSLAALQSLAGEPVHELPTTPRYVDVPLSASVAAVIGGGARTTRPGAVSLAHQGVLAVEDMAEHNPQVLDALRVPLDHHHVALGRSTGITVYPADILLTSTIRSCPCGQTPCTCTPLAIHQYTERIPGHLRDRIPLQVAVTPGTPLTTLDLDQARNRVLDARDRATHDPRRPLPLTRDAATRITDMIAMGELSARGADHVSAIAWTLATLDGTDTPTTTHVDQAIGLRSAGTLPSGGDPGDSLGLPGYTRTPADELPDTTRPAPVPQAPGPTMIIK